MARKATEFVQFKLRVREGLRAKIEREAKKKDHSSNNEAVARLEQSFEMGDKMQEFREHWEQRILDHQKVIQDLRDLSASEKKKVEAVVDDHKREMAKQNEQLEALERELETHKASANMVDVLLGENEASRDLIRKIAFELSANPEWDGNRAGRKAMADKIHAFIYPVEIFEGKK